MFQSKKHFIGKRPGLDSGDILHFGVNFGFSMALGALVLIWNLTPLAMTLVILSKWRTFAVQPRFWLPNIKANLVDVIVGVSSVGLMHQSHESAVAYIWIAVYAAWLLFIKPRSSEFWVSTQALVAQTLGLMMLFGSTQLVQYSILVVILAWIIAWASARHYFSDFDEPHYRALSLLWAFIMIQAIWYSLHWLQYFVVANTLVAASVLCITIVSITLASLYHAYKNHKLTRPLIIENTVLSTISVFAVLISSGWKPLL